MTKTVVVLGKRLLYKPDGSVWYLDGGKGVQKDKPLGTKTKQGYLQCTINKKQKKLHHIVWFMHYGYWPKNIDHINKSKVDNRVENLREGASINNHNRDMPLPSTGIRGALWNKQKGRYKSAIRITGKSIHLGYFNCPTAAHIAYMRKKEELLNG